MDKDINCIKAVLAEKKRTFKWLAENWIVPLLRYLNGVPMIVSQQWKRISELQNFLMWN